MPASPGLFRLLDRLREGWLHRDHLDWFWLRIPRHLTPRISPRNERRLRNRNGNHLLGRHIEHGFLTIVTGLCGCFVVFVLWVHQASVGQTEHTEHHRAQRIGHSLASRPQGAGVVQERVEGGCLSNLHR